MSSSDVIGKAVVGMGFGGYYFFKGIQLWRERRTIADRPVSKIRSVAMGAAALAGQVKLITPVKTPFTGRDCVYCSYQVEVPEKDGWRTVDSGCVQSIFYLDDGTGQMLVNPEGAQFFGPQTYQTETTSVNLYSQEGIAAWIREKSGEGWLGALAQNERHRFTESAIFDRQMIFVEGSVAKIRNVVGGVEREEPILGRKEDSGPMVLSAYSEEALLSRLGWQVPLQIFGGLALLLACLAMIVYH